MESKDSSTTSQSSKRTTCKFYLKNRCGKGATCKFPHPEPEKPPMPVKSSPGSPVEAGARDLAEPNEQLQISGKSATQLEQERKQSEENARGQKEWEEAERTGMLMCFDMILREAGHIWPFSAYGRPHGASLTNFGDLSMEEIIYGIRSTAGNPKSFFQVSLVNRFEAAQRQCRVFTTSYFACQKAIFALSGFDTGHLTSSKFNYNPNEFRIGCNFLPLAKNYEQRRSRMLEYMTKFCGRFANWPTPVPVQAQLIEVTLDSDGVDKENQNKPMQAYSTKVNISLPARRPFGSSMANIMHTFTMTTPKCAVEKQILKLMKPQRSPMQSQSSPLSQKGSPIPSSLLSPHRDSDESDLDSRESSCIETLKAPKKFMLPESPSDHTSCDHTKFLTTMESWQFYLNGSYERAVTYPEWDYYESDETMMDVDDDEDAMLVDQSGDYEATIFTRDELVISYLKNAAPKRVSLKAALLKHLENQTDGIEIGAEAQEIEIEEPNSNLEMENAELWLLLSPRTRDRFRKKSKICNVQ